MIAHKKQIVFILFTLITFLFRCLPYSCFSQVKQPKNKETSLVYIDNKGIIRWKKDKSEIALFGVNYTAPFAHAYRVLNYLKIPHEKAIESDVYHMARLGFDAFRVHVWDCEVSDTLGNLIDNDHLRLFDYQLKLMKERGIKFLITPIAYWGNGYPEKDEKTPGFSQKYWKENCLTNPDAIKAQERYLAQFVNHVNQYTGIAYKDDPDIIAFEICNEPHHKGTAEETTNFINLMVAAIKNSGCDKPIFYNISHSINLSEAYFNSNIQGGTFQWYPTNLVHGWEIQGNFLPNVDNYPIPFAGNPKFKKLAKVVYEFDAADIGRSYMYPYMAKSFREAGFQFAAQFAYDPLYMAFANTEYTTHYMNLAYAPQKALSLKIAGEVFHRIPLGRKSATYPTDSVFDGFRVSYKTDLSEMVTNEKFIYTNNTQSNPPSPDKLNSIAGYGNSPIVTYEGCGAYFIDKLENGIWRLEVMPDAIWVRDPFERASLKKEVSVIIWNKWSMTVNLTDLGENFSISGINDGNNWTGKSAGKRFTIAPGTYILSKNGANNKWKPEDKWDNIILKEFVAPATSCKKTYLLHTPFKEIVAGRSVTLQVKVVSPDTIESVDIYAYLKNRWPEKISMQKTATYTYTAEIPGNSINEGIFRYYISYTQKGKSITYPSIVDGIPYDWDFYGQPYKINVVKPDYPTCLFDASSDGEKILWPGGRYHVSIFPSETPGKMVVKATISKLGAVDQDNMDAEPTHDFSFKYFFKKDIQERIPDLTSFKKIVIRGYSLMEKPCPIQIALVTDEGIAYGDTVILKPDVKDCIINLKDLKKVKTVNLPAAYPSFMPYFFNNKINKPFDITKTENIQFSIGPGIPESDYNQEHSIAIETIYLE